MVCGTGTAGIDGKAAAPAWIEGIKVVAADASGFGAIELAVGVWCY
jgi:hypothetical protein